ncbi:hypothetical protein FRB94_001455 [Tulasnella sp. JGI-2019a]|nr:hypothetical protein FRB93_003650 [Tulasnella sp. JGI-2019a]KAG9005528.1 hypothetical protein FRB94_001455 [Tulasnella sp. JGI-2019a]
MLPEYVLASSSACWIDPAHLVMDEGSNLGSSGFGILIRACYTRSVGAVTVRRLSSADLQPQRVVLRLKRELDLWWALRNPHIHRIVGYHVGPSLDSAIIVCPLEPLGNITQFIQRECPDDAQRLELALHTLCGLAYLHSLPVPIVHGDIRASNILVDRQKRAMICDLGLAGAMAEADDGLTSSGGLRKSIRWCAPELLSDQSRSAASDVWAWACFLLEILKEKIPYHWIKSDVAVIGTISKGILPEKKESLRGPVDIWPVLRRCWELEPAKRTSAVACLQSVYSVEGIPRQLSDPVVQTVTSFTGSMLGINHPQVSLNWQERKRFKEIWSRFDPDGTGFLGRTKLASFLYALSGTLQVRIYPPEFSTPIIKAKCQAFMVPPNVDSGKVESTIHLERLAAMIERIDYQRVKIKKLQYNRIFQDATVNIEPGKGISYTNMMLVLSRYRTPRDSNIHRIEASRQRRTYAEYINSMVNLELARSLLKGYIERRKFLTFRKFKAMSIKEFNISVEGSISEFRDEAEIPEIIPSPSPSPEPDTVAPLGVPDSQGNEPSAKTLPLTETGSPKVHNDIPEISDLVVMTSNTVVARGGFYAVYRGRHAVQGDVALRRPLDELKYESEDLERRFWREANIWYHLRHKNISALLGVFCDTRGYYMVSPWQENGSIMDCIKRGRPVHHLTVLRGIANALSYLHSKGFAHGDLKLENVLLSLEGEAVLNDFGLTRQTETTGYTTTAMSHAGNFRWLAPEIIEGGKKSKEGDIYAFGMVVAEILTRRPPFWNIQLQGPLIIAIITGKRPEESDIVRAYAPMCVLELWELATRCWVDDSQNRPSAAEISDRLQTLQT